MKKQKVLIPKETTFGEFTFILVNADRSIAELGTIGFARTADIMRKKIYCLEWSNGAVELATFDTLMKEPIRELYTRFNLAQFVVDRYEKELAQDRQGQSDLFAHPIPD